MQIHLSIAKTRRKCFEKYREFDENGQLNCDLTGLIKQNIMKIKVIRYFGIIRSLHISMPLNNYSRYTLYEFEGGEY